MLFYVKNVWHLRLFIITALGFLNNNTSLAKVLFLMKIKASWFNSYKKGGTERAMLITPYWSHRNLLSPTPKGNDLFNDATSCANADIQSLPIFSAPSSDQYQLQPFSSSLNIHFLWRIWQPCSKALCSLCGNFPQQYNPCSLFHLCFTNLCGISTQISLWKWSLFDDKTATVSAYKSFFHSHTFPCISINWLLPYSIHWGSRCISLSTVNWMNLRKN